MGGSIATFAASGTAACYLSPSNQPVRERIVDGRVVSLNLWAVTFEAGTDVLSTDRVSALGRIFEVVSVVPHAALGIEIGRFLRVTEST
jgi:hypothetical protein